MNLPLLHDLGRRLLAVTSICALCGCLNSTVFAADNPEPVNWDRAREFLRKSQQGGQLSHEDQVYLDHAKEVRAKGGQNSAGNNLEMQRARQLTEKQKSGQPLTDNEKAFLKQAYEKYGKSGKGDSAGPTAPPPRETTGLLPLDQM